MFASISVRGQPDIDWSEIDVKIYLLDRSFLHGSMIDNSLTHLTFSVLNGDTLSMPHGLIKHYKILDNSRKTFYRKGSYHYHEGNFVDIGMRLGFGGVEHSGHTGLDLKLGHRINERWSAGLSLAWMNYTTNIWGIDYAIVPVSVFSAYHLGRKKTRVSILMQLGYGGAVSRANTWPAIVGSRRGGIYASPTIQWVFGSKNSSKFRLSFGYDIQKASGQYSTTSLWDGTTELFIDESLLFIRPHIGIGWQIN